ncbi:hypothetical protein JTE90_029212 [Oedothorax gibbosus]|uniref:Uncharacterized protein n=1 Tax=Oedothorax gibbosus TaxID=931172 RepID=A0AAV6VCF6_9ARAC|nr:hypothetical protein JTE90_029212 [Oedothorax gibbosus]
MLARYIREVNVHVYPTTTEPVTKDPEISTMSTCSIAGHSVDDDRNEQQDGLRNNMLVNLEAGERNLASYNMR